MPIFRGKEFVSSLADRKDSVRLASASNINLLSTSVTSIDGVAIAHTDRVLLTKQTTASQNGIYVYSSTTSKFVRAKDADTSAEVTPGLKVYVEEGDTNSQSDFVLSNVGNITIGVTPLVFTKTSATISLDIDGHFGASNKSTVIAVNKQGQVTSLSDIPIYLSNVNLEFDSITINGAAIPLGADAEFTTDDFNEGATNLYFSQALARAAISVSGDLNYNGSTGVISYSSTVISKELIESLNINIDGGIF